jgi:protein ImuA
VNKAEIISTLKREIQPMQGLSKATEPSLDAALWFLKDALPAGKFPLGCSHEFLAFHPEDMAATRGFICSLLSHIIKGEKIGVWISGSRDHFPTALHKFSVSPDQFFFIRHHNEKELWWVAEEFLKYEQLSVVVVELRALDFTVSRRFQLAVEKSQVTAFVLRTDEKNIRPNTCVARWQIKSIPSYNEAGLPGVGFPCWQVELQRIRNGKPALVELQYRHGKLTLLNAGSTLQILSPKKAV